MKWRKIVYKYIYDPLYSIYYSFKDIVKDAIDLIKEFRKPKTWSAILYVACFYTFMTRNYTLFKWLVPLIALVYMIRQKIDGRYKHELVRKAFKNDNDTILEDEYQKYKRECHFTKQLPMDYIQWKESERRKMKIDTDSKSSEQ